MRHLFRSAAVLALVVASSVVAQSVDAQTLDAKAQAAADKAAAAAAPEDIVVTARKREETVREIPSTITAISATQLLAAGPIVGTGDLLRTVAGARFNDLQASNLSEISIRGSGTERATGADSGVGLFFNGAYVGSSTLGGRNFKSIDMFDPERIEVLEGPQGALYGRNSEFGLVNIVSAKPKFNNSGYVDESYTGELQQNKIMAVENYAVSNEIAARVGVESITQNSGFEHNPINGKYYDHTDGWLARGQVRWVHGPLDVNLLVDGQDMNLPVFVNPYKVAPGVTATVPLGFIEDRYAVPSDGLNDTQQKVARALLTADYKFSWATLTSTSMATNSSSLQHYGSPIDLGIETMFQKAGEVGVYPLAQVYTTAKDRTLYEDLHLSGNALAGSLDWLGGLEILRQHDTNGLSSAINPCTLKIGAGICGGTPTAPTCYLILPTSTNCPTVFGSFGSVSTTPQRYTSEAAYGSLRYRIGSLTFNGELRYTDDSKAATQSVAAIYTGVPIGTPTSYTFKSTNTSYTFTVSWKLPGAGDGLAYAKNGTGYRAGGVNSGVSTPLAPITFRPTYNNENTSSSEVGYKGSLTPNIFLTIDTYMSETDNAITSITDGCTALNVCKQAATVFNINGGTVRAHGIESVINSHFQFFGGRLGIDLTLATQRAHYASLAGTYAGLPIYHSKVAQIPLWTDSATIDYQRHMFGQVDGFFHVVYNGQSGGGQDTVTAAIPFVPLSSLSNVTLRTGVRFGKVEAAVFVQNATNETVQLLKLQTAGVPYANRYNEPRTIGVNLVYRW